MIYFDYNSTAPYSPLVREYLQANILEDWQNPSSVYPQAQVLDQRLKECRKAIAEHLNCSPKNMFFTSGGTESINTILSPETLRLNQLSGFITSPLEHHASLKRLEYLSQNRSFYQKIKSEKYSGGGHDPQTKIHWVGHNSQGEMDLNSLEKICSQNPCSLLSFLSANNETGVINNIQEISKIARKYKCLVHIDMAQSLGKIFIDLEDVDFASFSGHKVGAMKGIGLLYAKKAFAPLMQGGGQEQGFRPGTYNFPAIYSLKLAVQDIDFSKWEFIRKLRNYFENSLLGKKEDETTLSAHKTHLTPFKINCQGANRLPNTTNLYCGPGISNQAVLLFLAQRGICVSTGSACNAGSPEPSHVLTNLARLETLDDPLYDPRGYARSCIRVSFSPNNTKQEVDNLIGALYDFHSKNHRLDIPAITL